MNETSESLLSPKQRKALKDKARYDQLKVSRIYILLSYVPFLWLLQSCYMGRDSFTVTLDLLLLQEIYGCIFGCYLLHWEVE